MVWERIIRRNGSKSAFGSIGPEKKKVTYTLNAGLVEADMRRYHDHYIEHDPGALSI